MAHDNSVSRSTCNPASELAEPWTGDTGPGTVDFSGPGTVDLSGPGTVDAGPGTGDRGPWTAIVLSNVSAYKFLLNLSVAPMISMSGGDRSSTSSVAPAVDGGAAR